MPGPFLRIIILHKSSLHNLSDGNPASCNQAWAEWEAWAACPGWVEVTSAAFQACLLLQMWACLRLWYSAGSRALNHEASVEWAWGQWAE